jgi:hypothetical protein
MVEIASENPGNNAPTRHRVLIYESAHQQFNFLDAIDGARKAKWQALAYTEGELALEEFDETINALILGVAPGKHPIEGKLLDRSNELWVPRAVFASRNSPNLARYLRPDFPDTVLDRHLSYPIERIADWLGSLVDGAAEVSKSA